MLNKIIIDEANKDFDKAIQIVRENGSVVITMNEEQYILQRYNNDEEFADDASIKKTSEEFIGKYLEAFKELAK
jgi:hypothetical protein